MPFNFESRLIQNQIECVNNLSESIQDLHTVILFVTLTHVKSSGI